MVNCVNGSVELWNHHNLLNPDHDVSIPCDGPFPVVVTGREYEWVHVDIDGVSGFVDIDQVYLLDSTAELASEALNLITRASFQNSSGLVDHLCRNCRDYAREVVSRRLRQFQEEHFQVIPACDIPDTSFSWKLNCSKLFHDDYDVPQDALAYALEVMRLNATSFASRNCYEVPDGESHRSLEYVLDEDGDVVGHKDHFNSLMESGLPNKCQFVINDIRQNPPEDSGYRDNRRRMYFIDLCEGDGPVIRERTFGMGSGSLGALGKNQDHRFQNASGHGTTLVGAFFTTNYQFDFNSATTRNGTRDIVYYDNQAVSCSRTETRVRKRSNENEEYQACIVSLPGGGEVVCPLSQNRTCTVRVVPGSREMFANQGVPNSRINYQETRNEIASLSEGEARAPSVALMGLQNSNSTASHTGKYMHVSPFDSSQGCPSLKDYDYDIIETLAANGPSLVVNYTGEDDLRGLLEDRHFDTGRDPLLEDLLSCSNIEDDNV